MTDEPAAYSGAWLRSRSDEELRAILDGSFPTSAAFEGVSGELTRREAEVTEKRQLFWIKLTFWTALLIGISGIAATLLH